MTVRIGILGNGYMGNFHYNKALQVQGAQVVSAHDISEEKLEDAKAKGLEVFTDRAAFLASDIDLVVVSTPNQFHKPFVIEALEAGKNVLCEKPVTFTTADLEEMIAAAERSGKILSVHQNRRWDADYYVVKQMLASGQIGKPVCIESRVLGERGVCFGWRADPESGGGMLYDWGPHLIDQILLLDETNKVKTVFAQIKTVLTASVDDFDRIELIFENGMSAHIEVGTFALQKHPRWFVYGDRGTLKLDDFTGEVGGANRIKEEADEYAHFEEKAVIGPSRTMAPLSPDMLEKLTLPQAVEEPLAYYENLIAAIEGREKSNVQMYQVRRCMKIIDAAFESGKKGCSIAVDI